MFRAIGFLIMLWGLSTFFADSFNALDRAATESFKTLEIVATVTQHHLREQVE